MHYAPEEIQAELRRLVPGMPEDYFRVWAVAVLDPNHALHESARDLETDVMRAFVAAAERMQPVTVMKRPGLCHGKVVGSLRACLQRSRSGCETPHHQVDHGDADPRLGGLRQGFDP